MKALVSGTCTVLSESLLKLVLAWAEVPASLAPALRLARTVMGRKWQKSGIPNSLFSSDKLFHEGSELTILKSPKPKWHKVVHRTFG